jgi:hypothetical protein
MNDFFHFSFFSKSYLKKQNKKRGFKDYKNRRKHKVLEKIYLTLSRGFRKLQKV